MQNEETIEINKFIHEKILGKCWHEDGVEPSVCRCGAMNCSGYPGDWSDLNPSYTSDLNALREAELKAVKEKGYPAYIEALYLLRKGRLSLPLWFTLADAPTRAKALVALYQPAAVSQREGK